MPTETKKKLFNVDDYYKMAEAGILGPEDRVELINGEIIQMSPIGIRHAARVTAAVYHLSHAFDRRTVVYIQNPVRLDRYNEPEPDVSLLKPRTDFYNDKRVMPEDVLLIVEVSDTTLAYDRNVKLPLYAAAQIPEVWIEDLQNNLLLVFRDPVTGSYQTCLTLTREDAVSVQAFPDVAFKVSEFLG
jgi:Uma2 family endonuclease